MSEDVVTGAIGVGIACLLAAGFAHLAAKTHPVTWGAVFGAALMLVFTLGMVDLAGLAGRAELVAFAVYGLAVFVGALKGTRELERQQREEAPRTAARLAHLARIGPCVSCGSGALDRNTCDDCRATYCAGCGLKHSAWMRRHGQCPTPTETRALVGDSAGPLHIGW